MSAIIAASGFLTAIVVLIVERVCRHDEVRDAERKAYFQGYQHAITFIQSEGQPSQTKAGSPDGNPMTPKSTTNTESK